MHIQSGRIADFYNSHVANKSYTAAMQTVFVSALAFMLCFASPSMAQEGVPVPTLDKLSGQAIPDTVPVQYYPESAYTLTPAETSGVNTVTKYEFNKETNKLEPKYYTLDLKQKEYGHINLPGAEVKDIAVTVPNTDNSGNAFEFAIKYYVDSNRLSPDRITAGQNGVDINSDFIVNYVSSPSGYEGSAIHNYNSTIGDITGDFAGNYASSTSVANASGGAIFNKHNSTIGDITGNFIGNYALSTSGSYGGAIYNGNSTIGDITGDFVGNYALSTSVAWGGAISGYSDSTIGDITGNFIGNYASSTSDYSEGGAIYNIGTIGNITGDFIGNYASSTSDYSRGGAIYNTGTIGIIQEAVRFIILVRLAI